MNCIHRLLAILDNMFRCKIIIFLIVILYIERSNNRIIKEDHPNKTSLLFREPKKRQVYMKNHPEEMGNYFEGDIVLNEKTLRNGIFGENYRWPDRTVPFTISGDYTRYELNIIKESMETFHMYTCIRFRQKRPTDEQSITITYTRPGCSSRVGNQQELNQEVNLDPQCFVSLGTTLHELMHVVGFWHEQNRKERDSYVYIIKSNIKAGMEVNFNKTHNDLNFGQPYDYSSIMHYSPIAFSKNGQYTIIPKNKAYFNKMGQRLGFSKTDIAKVNAMYRCPEKTKQLNLEDNIAYFKGRNVLLDTFSNMI